MLTITDKTGKAVNLEVESIDQLLELVNAGERRRNKVQKYESLNKVTPAEGDKGIQFHFENEMVLEYDFVTNTFKHGSGVPFLPSHFINIDLSGEGVRGFWANLRGMTDSKWIKTFFAILAIHCNHMSNEKKIGAANRIKRLADPDYIETIRNFEGIAKSERLQEISEVTLYNMWKKYKTAKDIIKNAMSQWFSEHADEQVNDEWNGSNSKLSSYVDRYQEATTNKMAHVFEYCWEKYRKPIGFGYYSRDKMNALINTFAYDYKRLIDYVMDDLADQGKTITSESWSDGDILATLFDYAKMNHEMGVKYNKYPKYLATEHDITAANYRVWQNGNLQKNFDKLKGERYEKMVFENEEYAVIAPKDIKDIIREGSCLSHCVGSYAKDVANGVTNILFMRTKEKLDTPLITLQVDNEYRLNQYKGHSNRLPEGKEAQFLDLYRKHLAKVAPEAVEA